MQTFDLSSPPDLTARYASCIDASKRVRWDIERDVIRGRSLDFRKKFLPDSLSLLHRLEFLRAGEARLLSQIQGRTYAQMFALVERAIGAKTVELSRSHALGDQVAFEALVRLTDEELKHQALFRRLDGMADAGMPAGYRFLPQADQVAQTVLGKSTWAVLGWTLDIELFSQVHYRASIGPEEGLDPLWKDVFRCHWLEESQHAILDELEWRREHGRIGAAERDAGVDDLIALVGAVLATAQAQAAADTDYFLNSAGRAFATDEESALRATMAAAYRWQYVDSGAQTARFVKVLGELTTDAQRERIAAALGTR